MNWNIKQFANKELLNAKSKRYPFIRLSQKQEKYSEIVIYIPLHIPPDTTQCWRKKRIEKKNGMKMSTIISVLSLLIFFNFFSLKCFTLKHIVFLIILSILNFFFLLQFSHLILSIFLFWRKTLYLFISLCE